MKNILIILFLISSFGLFGQEDIHLHFDKNFYVLGEQVWFSAYLQPQSSTAKRANQLRIAVLDKAGQSVKAMNLPVQNGTAAGMLTIPLNWKDGVYNFVAYTVWNPSSSAAVTTTVQLPIYNDFKSYKKDRDSKSIVAADNAVKGTISTNSKSYKRRTNVTVSVDFTNSLTGMASVTVVPKGNVEQLPMLQATRQNVGNGNTASNAPEKANQFYGKIDLKSYTDPLLGVGVHFSKEGILKWTTPDANGIFQTASTLAIPQTLQVFGLFTDKNRKTYTVPLKAEQHNTIRQIKTDNNSGLIVNDYIRTYLQKSQQRKKYQTIFEMAKPTFATFKMQESTAFKADETFNISDYSSMLTLEEFLQEVIPYVKIKSKKDKRQVRMFNEQKEYGKDNPVYLIDGWITHDQQQVFDIPISEIVSVEVYRITNNLKTQFGKLGENGVIGITTKRKNQRKALQTATNVVQSIGLSTAPAFKTSTVSFNKTPDFRSTIYWNPKVEIKNGKANFTFPHSDDLGAFTIIVNGMTTDGQLIQATGDYVVE